MKKRALRLALAVALSAMGMQASIVTFNGLDDMTGPTDPHLNSDAAAASMAGTNLIDFESAPLGLFTNLVLGGVTITVTNEDSTGTFGGIRNTDQHFDSLGFNITTGGANWLQYAPNFNDPAGATITFTFANPVTSFGAYFTDTEDGFPGPISLNFNDGASQSLTFNKTSPGGGTIFFGFSDTTPFQSVSINGGATAGTRDIWGIDNVAFTEATAAPEPGTFGLMGGTSLLGLSYAYLRRRSARQ